MRFASICCVTSPVAARMRSRHSGEIAPFGLETNASAFVPILSSCFCALPICFAAFFATLVPRAASNAVLAFASFFRMTAASF